jgi:Immunity protein 53
MNEFERLQAWYQAQCDGDWEHSFGVTIGTLDNPGWTLTVDLEETPLAQLTYPSVRRDVSETDWIQCEVAERQWRGAAGSGQLLALIHEFVTWVDAAATDSTQACVTVV